MRNAITELAVSTVSTEGDCPPPLVGATTTTVGGCLYLFAGRLTDPRILTNDLYILNLATFIWRKVNIQLAPSPGSPDIPPPSSEAAHAFIRPRYFHSAVVYGRKIIYFGGMGRLQAHSQNVGVLNDILILDTESLLWTVPRMTSGLPPPRYAHLCTLLDNHRMLIMGGQNLETEYLGDLHILNLRTMGWCVSRRVDRNVGIYRSIVANDAQHDRVIIYSNHNFNDVQRSLHVLTEPNWRLTDRSDAMTGTSLPPGLRFPTASRLGHHLIMSGSYIGSDTSAFRIWALDLRNYSWQEIGCGPLFERGSWNKGFLCADYNRFYVFGKVDRDLAEDYNSRQLNFNHVRVISLEAFGLYRPLVPAFSIPCQELGLAFLDNPAFSDVDIITGDGLRIAFNSYVMAERWPRMAEQLVAIDGKAKPSAAGTSDRRWLTVPENYDTVYQLGRYIYTRVIDPGCSTKLLAGLIGMAERYGMAHLKELCALEMHQRMALDTSPLIFEGATRAHHQGLRVRALLYMFDRREAL
ncbi:hypothetical protein BJ085DRAFT_2373, partial [Dimargaris cristalligena]